jgi:polyphosphate kinase
LRDDRTKLVIAPTEDPSEVSLGVSATQERYVNRELSWLSFNERVLQEAETSSVPLFERITFLAIFSSNLDEFFRVRVASLRSLLELGRKKRKKKGLDPTALLVKINAAALAQQERFCRVFREEILPELSAAGIELVDERGVDGEQREIIDEYFTDHVVEHLRPVILERENSPPFLKDHTSYLVAEFHPGVGITVGTAGPELGIVEVPSPPLPRFLSLTGPGDGRCIVFLDDVIRMNLHRIFPERVVAGAYAIKVSRDAGLKKAIAKSLRKRETGTPIRFLYDVRTPQTIVTRLSNHFGLREGDLIEGGRYHNLNDLADLYGLGRC